MMTTNTRDAYFATNSFVGKVVDKTLERYLDADTFGEYKRVMYEPLLQKKRGVQKARATLAHLSYCALTNTLPSEPICADEAKLITVPDLELWSEYMANWIFDNKGGVVGNPLIRKKAAVATKSFLEDAIKLSLQVGPEYVHDVLQTSGNVTESFAKELVLDLSNSDYLNMSADDFTEYYATQYAIPGIGTTFSLGCDLVARYAGKQNSPQAKELHDIFLEFGAYHEILNDLGDFVLSGVSTDKIESDQLSDIRNGALTVPIWQMYTRSSDSEKEQIRGYVGANSLTSFDQATLVKSLFETGTFETVSKYIKHNGRELKKRVRQIGFRNEAGRQLQQGISVLESNKIYHALRESLIVAEDILAKAESSSWRDELL